MFPLSRYRLPLPTAGCSAAAGIAAAESAESAASASAAAEASAAPPPRRVRVPSCYRESCPVRKPVRRRRLRRRIMPMIRITRMMRMIDAEESAGRPGLTRRWPRTGAPVARADTPFACAIREPNCCAAASSAPP